MSLLDAEAMHGGYGGADILKGVSLRVEAGEIVGVFGPNGAGKSTAMKAIFGLIQLREGTIRFDGEEITNLAPDRLVRRGMGYVPQERNVFPNLTVKENLEMGAYIRNDDISSALAAVFEVFPPLKDKAGSVAGLLSGGQRQMVAMGRAMMLAPRLLLLDEPTAGLAPKFIAQIFERILDINRAGTAILMVEQNARSALEISHRGYVLAGGETRIEDSAANLLASPAVAEAFLGGRATPGAGEGGISRA